MLRRVCSIALLVLLCAGCSSDGDGDPQGTPGACADEQLALTGSLDEKTVSSTLPWTGFAFVNGAGGRLEVSYAGGKVSMTLAGTAPYDETVGATGTIQMPAGTPHEAETICAASGSVTPHQDRYEFQLADLSLGPTCPGQALAGTIQGCAGNQHP